MSYFILAFIIVGLIGIVSSMIRGSYLIRQDKKLTENAVRRGYEYGIYYELKSGIDTFCFVHKDLIKANKSLSHLRKEGWFSQTEDWEGQVYCFTVESFEKTIEEQIDTIDRTELAKILSTLLLEGNIKLRIDIDNTINYILKN